MRISTVIQWLLGASILAGFALLFFRIFIPSIGFRISPGLIAAAFITSFYCLPTLLCSTALERGRLPLLMWSGIMAAAVAVVAIGGAVVMSFDPFEDPTVASIIGSASIWTGYCGLTAGLTLRRTSSQLAKVLTAVALISTALFAAGLLLQIWFDIDTALPRHALPKYLASTATIALASSLLSLIVARLRQLASPTPESTDVETLRLDMNVWCPRCGQQQHVQTGGASCAACGLLSKVIVP